MDGERTASCRGQWPRLEGEASALDEQPEDEHGFADEGDPGDVEGVAGYEHGAETVDEVADSGDDEQDPDDLGDEPGPVGEVADQEQVDAEQDETGVPDVLKESMDRWAWSGLSRLGSTPASWLTATRNTAA